MAFKALAYNNQKSAALQSFLLTFTVRSGGIKEEVLFQREKVEEILKPFSRKKRKKGKGRSPGGQMAPEGTPLLLIFFAWGPALPRMKGLPAARQERGSKNNFF